MSGVTTVVRDVHELTDPRSLPGLELWLDSRYPNGIGSAMPFDGDPLSNWTDLSGQGRHISQATSSKRPLWRSQGKNLLSYVHATAVLGTVGNSATGIILSEQNDATNATLSKGVGVAPSGNNTSSSSVLLTKDVGWAFASLSIDSYVSVVTGKTVTVSAWVKQGHAGTMRLVTRINGTVNGSPNNTYQYSDFNLTANTWTRISRTTPIPADATYGRYDFGWEAGHATEGSTLEVSSVQMEVGNAATGWVPPATLPNGLPVVSFDGVDDVLQSVSTRLPVGKDSASAYIVCTYEASTGVWQSPLTHRKADGTNSEGIIHYLEQGYDKHVVWSGRAGGWISANSQVVPTWGAPTILASTHTPTTTSIWVRGGSTASGTGAYVPVGNGGIGTTPINVGAGSDLGTQFWFRGNIAAVLIFSENHNDATRKKVERMLSRTFGVTLS